MLLFFMRGHALEVANTAGNLSSQVTDLGITSLKITGTMNAQDFFFIAQNLPDLTTIDLTQVTVKACNLTEPHYWCQDFAADELPVGAFGDMKLTTVSLPEGLKSIGKAAFAGCTHLTGITWPATLDSIGDFAFAGCSSLTAVTLPANVRIVGNGAFMRCTALKSLTVEVSSRLARLEATALMDCPALTTISLGSAVKVMGERALAGSGIKNLDLTTSKNLTTVGDWVMVKTPVTSAKLPPSVTSLGDGAFLYGTQLEEIKLGGKVARLSDYTLAGTALSGNLDLTGVAALGDYALYNVSQLSVVELPATVTWLGTRAMAGMTGMTSLTSKASQVPALGENVWAGVNQSVIPLTVPTGSVELYKAADQWKEFLFGESWIRVDVNGDGEVNIADVNILVNIIQGYIADAATMQRADVNEDNEINITDINTVIYIIMNTHYAPAVADVNDLLRLDDVTINPGQEMELLIKLDHAGDYSALQCDIILPQGLSLVSSKGMRNYVTEEQVVESGAVRTVLYSMEQPKFDDDGDAVISLTVRADNALAVESEIVLSNVMLTDGHHVGWHVADYTARVTNSTGVEDLTANADRVWIEGRTLCIATLADGQARLAAINGMATDLALGTGVNRFELEPGFYVVVLNGNTYKISIR